MCRRMLFHDATLRLQLQTLLLLLLLLSYGYLLGPHLLNRPLKLQLSWRVNDIGVSVDGRAAADLQN